MEMHDFRLDDRVALVTGAGRGLGAAAATASAAAGAEVTLVSRTEPQPRTVSDAIAETGGTARALPCDVCDAAFVRKAIGSLERIDVLLNNAGMNIPEPFTGTSEEHLDWIIALNIRAAFVVKQAAVRKMLEWPRRRDSAAALSTGLPKWAMSGRQTGQSIV